MDRYEKGRVEEEGLTAANIPIQALPPEYGWILLSDQSKVAKLVSPAVQSLKSDQCLVIAGSGFSTSKVSELATSVKREMRNNKMYEIRKSGARQIHEYWVPNQEGLDTLVATRHIPTLHILLSTNKIDTAESDVLPNNNKERRNQRGGDGRRRDNRSKANGERQKPSAKENRAKPSQENQ